MLACQSKVHFVHIAQSACTRKATHLESFVQLTDIIAIVHFIFIALCQGRRCIEIG